MSNEYGLEVDLVITPDMAPTGTPCGARRMWTAALASYVVDAIAGRLQGAALPPLDGGATPLEVVRRNEILEASRDAWTGPAGGPMLRRLCKYAGQDAEVVARKIRRRAAQLEGVRV